MTEKELKDKRLRTTATMTFDGPTGRKCTITVTPTEGDENGDEVTVKSTMSGDSNITEDEVSNLHTAMRDAVLKTLTDGAIEIDHSDDEP